MNNPTKTVTQTVAFKPLGKALKTPPNSFLEAKVAFVCLPFFFFF